jgi:hypothetical protein
MAKPYLDDEQRAFVESLQSLVRRRFLDRDDILNATTQFLFRFVDRFHGDFRDHPYVRPSAAVPLTVESGRSHWHWPPEREEHAQRLIEHVHRNWSHGCSAVHLVKSCYFDVSDFALLFEVDDTHLPNVDELDGLRDSHWSAGTPHASRIHLYLLLSNCAIQIDLTETRGGWISALRGVLSPFTNPDLYELISRSECSLEGSPRCGFRFRGWTPIP